MKKLDCFNLSKAAYRGKAKEGELPDGFTPIKSFYDENTGYNGFAVVNNETKELIITSAGHVLIPQLNKWNNADMWSKFFSEWILDTASALSIALWRSEPAQFKSAVNFTNDIINEGYQDYNITFAGHSMGATLSELLALKYNADGKAVKAISFDGIGSYDIALNMFGQDSVDDMMRKDAIQVYNLAPNFFTKLASQKQIGDEILIDKDGSDSWFNFKHAVNDLNDKFDENGDFSYQAIRTDNYELQGLIPTVGYGINALQDSIADGMQNTKDMMMPVVNTASDAFSYSKDALHDMYLYLTASALSVANSCASLTEGDGLIYNVGELIKSAGSDVISYGEAVAQNFKEAIDLYSGIAAPHIENAMSNIGSFVEDSMHSLGFDIS